MPELRKVAIAVVRRADRWLVARRHASAHLGGLWEFPGGKCEENENAAQAAVRELREECGVNAAVFEILDTRNFSYPDREIELTPVICAWVAGEGEPLGCTACAWVTLDEIAVLPMPAANESLLAELRRRFDAPSHLHGAIAPRSVDATERSPNEWRRGEFVITTDRDRINAVDAHAFLSQQSYWARGIPLATVGRSIDHSLAFGILHETRLVGFARLVTDRATFAWVSDVFVLPDFRGRGLSKWLMEVMLSHPDVRGLRRWLLATQDAHNLYEQFGFVPLSRPERFMERHDPHVYAPRPSVTD